MHVPLLIQDLLQYLTRPLYTILVPDIIITSLINYAMLTIMHLGSRRIHSIPVNVLQEMSTFSSTSKMPPPLRWSSQWKDVSSLISYVPLRLILPYGTAQHESILHEIVWKKSEWTLQSLNSVLCPSRGWQIKSRSVTGRAENILCKEHNAGKRLLL